MFVSAATVVGFPDLHPLDSGSTLLTRTNRRFNGTELRTIGGTRDVLVGETSEGLRLVLESHRCHASDFQDTTSAPDVCINAYHPVYH